METFVDILITILRSPHFWWFLFAVGAFLRIHDVLVGIVNKLIETHITLTETRDAIKRLDTANT